jgi:hypothetical protein
MSDPAEGEERPPSRRRGNGCPEKHYLLYLDALGYQLSDVEQLAAGIEPSSKPTGSDD